MKNSTQFSLVIFAPVLIAFLLPAGFLLPSGGLLIVLAAFDPTVPMSGAVSYNLWVIGPVLAACSVFLAGRGLYAVYRRGRWPRAVWMAMWGVFTAALFLACWLGFIEITSIGASETPAHIFLGWTALFAAGLTLLAQPLVIAWLYIVSRVDLSLMAHSVMGQRTGRSSETSQF